MVKEVTMLPPRVDRKPIATPNRRATMAKAVALQAELLLERRGKLVHVYRDNPRAFPDGIDTKYDRWYRPEEWVEAEDGKTCVYVGPPAAGVTEMPAVDATIAPDVTEIDAKPADVTKFRRGRRPSGAKAMTAAERKAAERKRKQESKS